MEEQPADFARSLKIGHQIEQFGAEGAAQFLGMLGQRGNAVGVERPCLPDVGEDLAGAAHVSGRHVLED